MTNRWAIGGLLTAVLLGGAAPTFAGEEIKLPTLRIHAPIFKSNKKGKYQPFKSKSDETFQVTVRLFADPGATEPLLDDKGQPWLEVLTVTAATKDPASAVTAPAQASYASPSKIQGEFDLVIGGSKALPTEIALGDTFFTTQLGQIKNGEVQTPFAPSLPQPLGVSGILQGPINPSEVYLGGDLLISSDGQWLGDPSGLAGPTGPAGPTGAAGPQGPIGPTGGVGPAGPTGAAGPQGPIGPTGDIGPVGPAGPTGPQGDQGIQGVQGPVGPTGPQGELFPGGEVDIIIATAEGTSVIASNGNVRADGEIITGDGELRMDNNGSLNLRSRFDVQFFRDNDADDAGAVFEWFDNGDEGDIFNPGQTLMRLDSNDDLLVKGAVVPNAGFDVAEAFPTTQRIPAGTVVAVDPLRPEHVVPADVRNGGVIGIVSTEPAVKLAGDEAMGGLRPDLLQAARLAVADGDVGLAIALRQEWQAIEKARTDMAYVALAGRVPLRVDLSGGVIEAGDALGLSATPGVATKHFGVGPVVGIALEAWSGQGETVMVFVKNETGAPVSASGLVTSGRGTLARGATSIVVNDASVTPESLPVVTFYGNVGSHHWVAERGFGWFRIETAQPSADFVEFGYQIAP